MKFNFKKIASAFASTAMLGATVGLAAAASYPAPFVSGGAADVAVVYGMNLDLSAVTDITTSLSSALAASGGSAVTVSSEAYPLFTASTPLQLNTSINSVRTSVVETNLPTVLGDVDFSGNVDANVDFRIIPGSNPRVVFGKIPTTNDDPTVGVTMSTTSGNYLYNATATFSKAVAFNHSDSEGEDLILFGQNFVVASATSTTDLVLFRSASKLSLSVGGTNENPSEVITVGDETYTVELLAASDTSATIKVTDSSGKFDSKEINEAASKKINGLEVAVDTSDESSATNIIQAELIVGANKLTLTDGSEVKEGTDNTVIEGTNVDFNEGATTSPGNLTKLTLQTFAADGSNDAIRSGESYVDPIFASFRLAMTGLSVETDDVDNREIISVDASGNDKMTISFDDWSGNSLTNFEWANNESSAWGKRFLGTSEDWQIFVRERAKINESAYAVIGNEENGYLVQLLSISNVSGTSTDSSRYSSDLVRFKNVLDPTQTWDASITEDGVGDVVIGGKTYTVRYWDDKDGDNDEFVQLQFPDSSNANQMVLFPTIETSKGANFAFYEPQVVDFMNWDLSAATELRGFGATNLTGLVLPDGDGYTTVAVASEQATAAAGQGINDTFLINGGQYLNLSSYKVTVGSTFAKSEIYATVGKITYNITGVQFCTACAQGGKAADGGRNTTAVVQLMSGGNSTINGPALMLFEEKNEDNNYEVVTIEISGNGDSNNGVGVSDVDFTWNSDADMVDGSAYGASGFQRETNDKLYDMMDLWGTMVTTDQSTSDQYTAKISYPDNQVVSELYFDSITEAGGTTTLGDVKVMDDELSTSGMQTKNLISVGGSCVNTLSSTLLGGSAGCGTSWTAATGSGNGEWVIQTFANPWAASKVATLVGGWEQGDTANAASYLKSQEGVSTSVGSKLKGTTSTAATVVTTGTTA
jgi:hypothetical protein